MTKLRFLAMSAVAICASPVHAANCPAPVDQALRLVLVTASSMNTATAKMQLFERAAAHLSWTQASEIEPAVIGQAGLSWGLPFLRYKQGGDMEKREGDKRTPAGFFRIGPSFGFAPSNLPGYIHVKAGKTVCIEDPTSPHYNKIVNRSQISGDIHADEMRRTPLYRRGLFVNYPSDRAGRRGSCIFIHIWQAPTKGTAGCVGLPESRVEALQEFSKVRAVLAVLPEHALDRFPDCLPRSLPAMRTR